MSNAIPGDTRLPAAPAAPAGYTAPAPPAISAFEGRAFAFTGTLTGLKRTAAEREVRARGGLTTDRINAQLDFLVIGDTPNPAWKHGSYGKKIETARALSAGGAARPRLVSEAAFMEALALFAPTNGGEIDEQVVVATYKFVVPEGTGFDQGAVEQLLRRLETEYACHIAVSVAYLLSVQELFGDLQWAGMSEDAAIYTCRIVRHQRLDEAPTSLLEDIARGFEAVTGVDGRLTWFTRQEGSADFIRLLREIPSSTSLPQL